MKLKQHFNKYTTASILILMLLIFDQTKGYFHSQSSLFALAENALNSNSDLSQNCIKITLRDSYEPVKWNEVIVFEYICTLKDRDGYLIPITIHNDNYVDIQRLYLNI